MTKIIDSFLFFNELDLLDIRLNILYDYVDYFVITESETTFSGNTKELYFLKNEERFNKFKDKIVYNPVKIPSNMSVSWDREIFQRNAPIEKLKEISEDGDLIITSDLDEIPSPELLENYKDWFDVDSLYHFKQKMYMYYMNNYKDDNWYGTRACSLSYLKSRSIDDIRQATEDENKLEGYIIENAGWHFTYLGGENQIKYKLESFSHQEHNNSFIKSKIKESLNKNLDIFGRNVCYQIVDIDDSYPQYIIKNKKKFSEFIINDSN
jgi:beta-1,4-mannosyl-glycoprotein beta-1,4-N-acetylglucosaminyltransferase